MRKATIVATMAVLSHSNASTTLDVYTRVAPEMAREAANALDRVLTSRPDEEA